MLGRTIFRPPIDESWYVVLGTYGHLVKRFGHLWALHSGHSWSLVVTRGHSKVLESIALSTKIVGAGDGDRTRMASLEGWSSTIELHPHVSMRLEAV